MGLPLAKKGALLDKLLVGQEVIAAEASALLLLQESLSENFPQAIALIQQTQGRVVVSGMGKCSHIARKIAATLASTGQPAIFVHPAEAAHGDLGMITPNDILILLSNSGETVEITTLIHYAKRFAIPFIAITSHLHSTLAQMADISLILPSVPEACPMGLAPTTSTTMMLALGDAIAITLLSDRGFSNQDFQGFHPGGNLGSQLKKVQQCMHTGERLPLAGPGEIMSEVILTMTAKGLGCVGIIDEQTRLIGIITDGDLRRHLSANLLSLKAAEVMTNAPKVVGPNMLMGEALAFMNREKVTLLFVVDRSGTVLGLIHVHDFLRLGVM